MPTPTDFPRPHGVLDAEAQRQTHTPTPWQLDMTGKYATPGTIRANGIHIARVIRGGGATQEEYDANARFIVRAVNAHDALVAALNGLFEHCAMVHKHWGDGSNEKEATAAIENARAALRLAEGGSQ